MTREANRRRLCIARSAARIALMAIALLGPGHAAQAQLGLSVQRIVIGTSLPLSGPSAEYGSELARGMRLGFERINAEGGIGGRQIQLLAKDDGGQADRAAANTRALIDEGVLAATGYHGTRSIEAALPLLEQAGIPVIGVVTSAELTREPVRPLVFNLRAGTREEAAAIVAQLDSVGLTEIAAISQDDALGRAGREGVRIEMARLAMRPVVQAQIATDADVAEVLAAVTRVCEGRPQALVLLLNAANATAVLRLVRKLGCTRQVVAMSDAGAEMVANARSPQEIAGLVVSQVLPSPDTIALPVLADYRRQLDATRGRPSYPSLEGYLYARVIGEALARCSKDPSRQCLVGTLESRPVNVGGYRVQFSPTDRRGSKYVDMTIVSADGRFRR
jgi:branched-chain amino acid transport system substrate-binding protein